MKLKFSKDEALVLRSKGCTYLEISELLGCSIDWCKKNLAGAEKGCSIEKVVVDDTKQKAILILEDALSQLRML